MHSVFNKKLQRDPSVSHNVREDVSSLASEEENDFEFVNREDVSSLASEEENDFEFVNREDVSSLTSEEENDFEFVNREDIDLKEESIAGFTKEKLSEMCTFSKMAHCSNDETLSKKGYKTRDKLSKEKYRVTLFNYSNGRDAGLIFKKGKEVTIAYCGSRTIGDFITGGSVLPTIPSFLVDERGKIYGRVHKGYYNAFQDSFNALESELEHYAKAQNLEIKDLKINFTGHSMGGALAKIAALCLNKTKGAQDIHVATFGDPRVFFEDAKEAYNEVLGENTIRVSQHRQDPVPAVIPGAAGYAHVGTQLRIEKSPSDFPHKMDGYYGVIKGHQQYHFRPNNSASLFYYPVQGLKVLNCMILGNSQSAIVNYSGKQYSTPTEEKWYKEALSLAKVKKESNTGNNPNTKINLNQINQVVGEIRYL